MEREVGEGMKRRGRRKGGGEMRRRVIVGGMVIGLLMGCNNGIADELAAEKRLGEIGKSAEKIFYSFIELVSGVFNVTENTTRNEVKDYFIGLANGVDKTIQALSEIGNKMQQPSGNEQKSVSVESSNQEIENAKNTLKELKGHLDSLKDIGDGNKVVAVTASQNGEADGDALDKAHKALKGIVDIATKQKVEAPKKGEIAIVNTSLGGASPQNGARVFTTGNNAQVAAGPEAATIVSAVSGEAILAAIFESKENDKGLDSGSPDGQTSALKFAKGGTNAGNLANAAAKASAVAGGIALRSLTKGGKLATHNSNDEKAVQSAGITAVNKLLGAVEDVIKKTVKNVLDKVKKEVEQTRAQKTVSQQ